MEAGEGIMYPGNSAISDTLNRGQGAGGTSIVGLGESAPGKGALRSSLGLGAAEIVGPPEGRISKESSGSSMVNSSGRGFWSRREGDVLEDGTKSLECVDASE